MLKKFKSVQPKSMTSRKFDDVPLLLKLATAGAAGCTADLVTFPLDVAKVRLQVQGESSRRKAPLHYKGMFQTISTISKEEGPRSLYNGLTAGIQRQMCFASIRIGLYDTVKEFYQKILTDPSENRKKFDIPIRISAGITTGALSVLAAQPTDVVKVRFQAALPGKVDRYKTTTEAYKAIYKQEGLRGLWKGTFPNIARNAIVNVSEIVCYDLVKEALIRNKLLDDNVYCHFTSGVLAGFCATVVASPVDVIKTRYMNSKPGQYSSALGSAIKTAKEEGIGAFYKGFLPSFYRLVTWNIVMWVTYEKFKVIVGEVYSGIS